MKLTRLLTSIFLILFATTTFAQEGSADFTLGIIAPPVSAGFTAAAAQKLDTKIAQIINKSGETIVGYDNDFVVYPLLSVEDIGVVEGGMQNITVATIDIAFFVKQLTTNVVYNSVSKKLKGSGSTREQAISNAISQINPSDAFYKQFIITSKTKILKYFKENCNLLIQKATVLSKKHDNEQAIAILQSIPAESNNCYQAAQVKSLEYYKLYQSELCDKQIRNAKAEIALNHFEEAFQVLTSIEPSSRCSAQVNQLIAQISSKIEKRENKEMSMEVKRINAVRDIAKAYYSNRVHTVNYNLIIR